MYKNVLKVWKTVSVIEKSQYFEIRIFARQIPRSLQFILGYVCGNARHKVRGITVIQYSR